MKVVLFCGGQGMRLREYSETVPKPMVPVGPWPILWHVMRYFAHYGHRDFVVCLGYQGEVIEKHFAGCSEVTSGEWRMTFVDTGTDATIGERLRAARPHLDGEEMFLANYGDTLTDVELPLVLDRFTKSGCVAGFLAVRPRYTFHIVQMEDEGLVSEIVDVTRAHMWINGGYFTFRPEIFDYLGRGEDLVIEAFQRLIAEQKLMAYRHEGFWAPMDTLKERQELDAAHAAGRPPWAVWT